MLVIVCLEHNKYLRTIAISLAMCFSIAFSLHANKAQAETKWQQLAPGLEYVKITPKSNPWGYVHAFRIDLAYFQLDLAFAKDHDNKTSDVEALAKQRHAVLAVNGGFFTPEFDPIGLRIQNGKVRSRLKSTSWWGVFYIKQNKPYLAAQKAYRNNERISFAVQGGPRLIVNGNIPQLKEGDAERTAIGFTRDNKIIIVATENAPMSTTTLATLMANDEEENGLNCYNALNLDGGHSTQMYADIGNFNVEVSGFSSITDAVLVVPKHEQTNNKK